MKAVKELNTLMPDLLTCSCEGVVMSRDVRQRCQRVQARFQAANNLACHGMSCTWLDYYYFCYTDALGNVHANFGLSTHAFLFRLRRP